MNRFPVREAQYVQKNIEEVIVKVVKDNGYTKDTDHALIAELEKRLGSAIKITIQHVETLDRGKGNKLKTVISLIDENIKKNFLQGTNVNS